MQVGDNYVYGEYSLVSSKRARHLSLAVFAAEEIKWGHCFTLVGGHIALVNSEHYS